jgi:hypothetical protein
MSRRKLISFDWAMKKLLRSKANFEILEGFLNELLKDNIKILEILESESNKEDRKDKSCLYRIMGSVLNQYIAIQFQLKNILSFSIKCNKKHC